MSFQTCMWWQGLIGWPNGASDEGTLKCLDKHGKAEPLRNTTNTANFGGGTPSIKCYNSVDDDCNGFTSFKNTDVFAGGSSRLDTRSSFSGGKLKSQFSAEEIGDWDWGTKPHDYPFGLPCEHYPGAPNCENWIDPQEPEQLKSRPSTGYFGLIAFVIIAFLIIRKK